MQRLEFTFTALIAALLACVTALPLAAQTPPPPKPPKPAPTIKPKPKPLPKAEAVFARFVQASGGVKAIKSMTSGRQTLSVDVPMLGTCPMDLVMRRVVLGAGTKRERVTYAYRGKVNLGEGIGMAEEGGDGVTYWNLDPMQGPSLLEGDELLVKARSLDPLLHHHWKRYYRSIKSVARETIDGESCIKVDVNPKVGQRETAWFSEKTGFLVQSEAILHTAMGEIPIKTTLSDYRRDKKLGVTQPFKMVVRRVGMGDPQTIKVLSNQLNVEVKDEEIALPAEIQKLVDKRDGKKPKAEEPKTEKPTKKPKAEKPTGKPIEKPQQGPRGNPSNGPKGG